MRANSTIKIAGCLVDFELVTHIIPGLEDGELVLYLVNGENIVVSQHRHPVDYAALNKYYQRATSAAKFLCGMEGGK